MHRHLPILARLISELIPPQRASSSLSSRHTQLPLIPYGYIYPRLSDDGTSTDSILIINSFIERSCSWEQDEVREKREAENAYGIHRNSYTADMNVYM